MLPDLRPNLECFESLMAWDEELARLVAAARCPHCGGPLHQANYWRKPRARAARRRLRCRRSAPNTPPSTTYPSTPTTTSSRRCSRPTSSCLGAPSSAPCSTSTPLPSVAASASSTTTTSAPSDQDDSRVPRETRSGFPQIARLCSRARHVLCNGGEAASHAGAAVRPHSVAVVEDLDRRLRQPRSSCSCRSECGTE
jgi:hypothetical protein